MRRIVLFVSFLCAAIAQEQSVLVYSSALLTYKCTAQRLKNERIIAVTAASNANPVSFTATAHGFDYQSAATTTPLVKITGATGNWTPINGVWAATPTSANAFTIPVDSSAFGALSGTLVVSTLAPRTTDFVWAIFRYVYDGSNNLIWIGSGINPGGAGETSLQPNSSRTNLACASRTSYSYE